MLPLENRKTPKPPRALPAAIITGDALVALSDEEVADAQSQAHRAAQALIDGATGTFVEDSETYMNLKRKKGRGKQNI